MEVMKFKVGDKVRVVNAPVGLPEGDMVGEIHKVTMVDNNKIPYELSNRYWCREGDVEPIEDPLVKKIEERNNKPVKMISDENLLNDNSKADQHERLMNHLNEIYRAKNKDYGDAFGKSHEKYGAIAGLTRINDKFNRLEELILSGEQLVEDETVLDTLLDLANYSIMLYMELEEGE